MSIGNCSWRGLTALVLVCLGLAPAIAPSRAEPPPPASARIGDLTFHYDPLNWRIEPAGSGLTILCLQDDCQGVVFDVSVRDAYGECGEETVRQTAEQMFPAADRHPVNIVPAGRFGLVKAESRYGADLGAPTYVYACLDWQDREYRFATRPQTVGRTSWAGGALHYLVSLATAPPARIATLRLRDLEIPYSTEIWRATELVPGESYMLTCLPPDCRGDGAFVAISAKPSAAGCTFLADAERSALSDTIVSPLRPDEPDAPQFSIATTHSPCRNYVPPDRSACAWRNGIAYRIGTPGPFGCRSGFGVPSGAFTDLVSGARLAP